MPDPFASPKLPLLALALSVCLVTAGCPGPEVEEAPVPHGVSVAFVGVHVVPMSSEGVLRDRTVLVRGDRIALVGAAGEVGVPEGAVVVEGEGRYLMPGLAEMHGHLPGQDAPDELVERTLFLYLANGVTLVRGMQGDARQIGIRRAVEEGELLGPRLILGSPAMGWGRAPSPEEAPETIRGFREQGFDLVKIGEGLSPELYRGIVEAAREEGLPVAGHVPDEVGLLAAIEAGQATIDHLDNYVEELLPEPQRHEAAALWGIAEAAHLADPGRLPELVEATREAGTAMVPTMVLWEVFFGGRSSAELLAERPEVRYMPAEVVERWAEATDRRRRALAETEDGTRVVALRREVFQALHRGGAEILLGTDSPQVFSVPGFSTHREMALWVELGMTPYEVLRTGTWNVAAHLGELDEAGTVAPGKRADLVLVEGNPLEEISNAARIAGVMAAGRWLPAGEIEERLEGIGGQVVRE